jgi:hypothetical protein
MTAIAAPMAAAAPPPTDDSISPAILDDLDRRLAFLARSSARYELVERGCMDMEEALDGLLPDMADLVDIYHMSDTFDRLVEQLAAERRRTTPEQQGLPADWSLERVWNHYQDPRNRPTPQVVVEAILCWVAERGIAALDEPKNVERISRCDDAARKQIDARVQAMISKKQISI